MLYTYFQIPLGVLLLFSLSQAGTREAADTADLRHMTMTRAEFAHLYYPGSVYTRRPTRQEADLVWFLHIQDSEKGVSRALARSSVSRGGGRASIVLGASALIFSLHGIHNYTHSMSGAAWLTANR